METDPQRVRERAYFHFENQTGANWSSPDCNWLEAEAEEAALELAKLIQPYVCALLCHRGDPSDPSGVFAGGTGTFIDTGRARFILTAEHVVKELFSEGTRAILTAGNEVTPLDISDWASRVSSDAEYDLATIGLPDDFDPACFGRQYHRPFEWHAPRATKGEVAVFLGYPGLHRQIVEKGLKLHLTPFCDFVTSASDRHFVLADEESERVSSNLSGSPGLQAFGPIGGVSGSGVFVNRNERLVLVGVLYEASEGVDAIAFATHVDRIDRFGVVS